MLKLSELVTCSGRGAVGGLGGGAMGGLGGGAVGGLQGVSRYFVGCILSKTILFLLVSPNGLL